jgi:hypothetical protein
MKACPWDLILLFLSFLPGGEQPPQQLAFHHDVLLQTGPKTKEPSDCGLNSLKL